MDNSQSISRRRVLQSGARALGAVSLGGGLISLLDEGCARQPAGSTTMAQRLIHLQFTVQGTLRSTTALPFYYLAVINLTNNSSDPGPVPIVGSPPGNGIAAPAITSGNVAYQTFVGYVQYDTASENYNVFRCPIIGTGTAAVFQPAVAVSSSSAFSSISSPDSAVLPTIGQPNTFDATLNLYRLLPYPTAPLPRYAQVNFITYNYLASGDGYSSTHYWDGIGSGTRTTNDYAVLDTSTTESVLSTNFGSQQGDVENQFGQPVSLTSDLAIPNLYITSWAVALQ